jgi:hypothetical protein
MRGIKKIIYDCHHATYLIEKGQHTPLSLKDRITLLIHLSACSVCRLFRRQSRLINQVMHGFFRASAGRGHSLDESIKREMQQKINERLLK